MIEQEKIGRVLLGDGWHNIVVRSFEVLPMEIWSNSLGKWRKQYEPLSKSSKMFHFHDRDRDRALCGPMESILAYEDVTDYQREDDDPTDEYITQND